MIFRFSFYSFLKNQRYFEPFLILVFLEKGLDFFQIGLLIAFRECAVNLWEIPSGGIADVCGRRGSMVISFLAYITSFTTFGLATGMTFLFAAMFFYAIGDAFRSGTHKSMIFAWLRRQNRTKEKTKIYGLTRSWGKIGSALSVLLGSAFVFYSQNLVAIFYFSIIPYLINLVNIGTYPAYLDGEKADKMRITAVVKHLKQSLVTAFSSKDLRFLVIESMGFEGLFHSVKDYLQPVLKAVALGFTAGWLTRAGESEAQNIALTVGPVYFLLYLLSAWTSRNAHKLVEVQGGEEKAAHRIWRYTGLTFAAMTAAALWGNNGVVALTFVVLYALQNLWRPAMVARFDHHSDERMGATVMSLESQARRVATVVLAPVVGWAMDAVTKGGESLGPFWPIGSIGLFVALAFYIMGKPRRLSGTGGAI